MKFGRLFNKQKAEDASWRYLNYDMLKEMCGLALAHRPSARRRRMALAPPLC